MRSPRPRTTAVKVVVTGQGWLGGRTESVDTAMEELVMSARHELDIVAYRWSDGATHLLDLIDSRVTAGVRVRLVVDGLERQPGSVPSRLRSLATRYSPRCQVYELHDATAGGQLHAKCLVADRRTALVGSANLTWHGLVSYYELGVVIAGPEAGEVAMAVDRLVQNGPVRMITG